MIWLIANPIARALAKMAALVLAVLTFGAWNRHKGKRAERDRQAEERAKARAKTLERMQDAEAAMGDDPAVLRDRMRQRSPDQR